MSPMPQCCRRPGQVAHVVRAVLDTPHPDEGWASLGVHSLPLERAAATGMGTASAVRWAKPTARASIYPNEPASECSGIWIPASVPAAGGSVYEASLSFDNIGRNVDSASGSGFTISWLRRVKFICTGTATFHHMRSALYR